MKNLPLNARALCAATGILLLGLGQPVPAHHSAAMFDASNLVTIEGTVKELDWTNPHAWLHVMVSGKGSGAAVDWSIELGSPNNLYREGLRPSSLKPGDKISVTLAPLKDGAPGGQIRSMILPDGKPFKQGL